jgi:alpha-L-fucosidase
MRNTRLTLLCLLALCSGSLAKAADTFTETPAQHDARMAWWRDARFGMFIHWGLYAQAAGEWNGRTTWSTGEWIQQALKIPTSQYQTLVPQFDPEKFNARQWVEIAKNAGMKYIVITSKHHEGFAMFPSAQSDWGIKSTPFKRDPLAELSAACKAEGIKFGCYYSIMDWHHPDWGQREAWNDVATGTPDMDRYVAYMKAQLGEIITNYHPAVLWFDGEWEDVWTHERAEDLYAYLRALDPDVIINNRIDKARNGLAGMNTHAGLGDYGTPEQTIPANGFGPGVDWETCMTMNDTWGYKKSDHNWKSPEVVVRNLIDIASKGGNYLLNVGPTGEGLIPDGSVERLAVVGQWMKVNGQSIYGTTASPFATPLPWGRCTTKTSGRSTTLYLHVFNWPSDDKLFVPGLKNTVKSARLLGQHGKLTVQAGADGVTIMLPPLAPSAISSTIALRIKGEPEITAAAPQ